MSSNDTIPLPERVASSYLQLSAVAQDLNAVSDELGKAVAQIDTALKKLNLGITAWIKIAVRGADPEQGDFLEETDEVGYAKVSGKWGIALRTMGQDLQNGNESEDRWLFNDAPRALRLSAIEKLAELLDALASGATKTKEEIRARLGDAQSVADAVTKASGGRVPLRGIPPPPQAPSSGKEGSK